MIVVAFDLPRKRKHRIGEIRKPARILAHVHPVFTVDRTACHDYSYISIIIRVAFETTSQPKTGPAPSPASPAADSASHPAPDSRAIDAPAVRPGANGVPDAVSKSRGAVPAVLLLALALLSAVGPFATDLYLPTFPAVASDLDAGATGVQNTPTSFLPFLSQSMMGLSELQYALLFGVNALAAVASPLVSIGGEYTAVPLGLVMVIAMAISLAAFAVARPSASRA